MTAYSIMISIWGVLLTAFVALMVYHGTLANHETDQLFLNDEDTLSPSHEENDEVIRRESRIEPLCRGVGGAFAAVSLAVFGMIVMNLMHGAALIL